jgi:hypothetical protein
MDEFSIAQRPACVGALANDSKPGSMQMTPLKAMERN